MSSIEEQLSNTGLHSLNPIIINLYYGHLVSNISITDDYLMIGKIRGKSYLFCVNDPGEIKNKQNVRVHSTITIGSKVSKYDEVVYNLNELEERERYPSKKSFYNAVKYPVNFISKNYKIEILDTEAEVPYKELLNLYEIWVEQKIARGVHRISFPIARYRRCITMLGNIRNLHCIVCRNKEHKIVGFRIVLVDKEKAFDIVFVSDLDISQLSNCFNFASLNILKEQMGIQTFNCGVSTGKLKAYKQQYPNSLLTCYISGA